MATLLYFLLFAGLFLLMMRAGRGGFLRSRFSIGLILFLAIGAYLMTTEHRPHLFAALPWLLLLLCPLMHLFMHHGHDHGGGPSRPESKR